MIAAVADLSLGRACAGCDAPGVSLCRHCTQHFVDEPRIVQALALDDVYEGLRIHVWATALYDGPVRAALVRFKDHGHTSLRTTFAHSLAMSVTAAVSDTDLVVRPPVTLVPIPSRRSARKRRGMDPLGLIVRTLAREASAHFHYLDALVDDRAAGSIKKLGSVDRAQAAAGAFRLHAVSSRPVIVVDDIVTTGATLTEATSALMHGGMHVIGAACIAHTPRH